MYFCVLFYLPIYVFIYFLAIYLYIYIYIYISINTWQVSGEEGGSSLEQLVCYTLSHASLSMLVTSLTTAAAFFGSIVSNITAIKCFR